MTLIKPSEPWGMTAEQAAQRRGYAAKSELALRDKAEALCRNRWPDARVVHEIVMGQGSVRADLAAISLDHIAAFEIKGESDNTTRLLHQVGMYQLCVPEVWMVVPYGYHAEDARLIRHLLPSVGLLVGNAVNGWESGVDHRKLRRIESPEFELAVEAEPVPREPVPKMMLEMLWRDELASACARTGCYAASKKSTRPVMIKALLELPAVDIQHEVCAELRSRNALWRADPSVTGGTAQGYASCEASRRRRDR